MNARTLARGRLRTHRRLQVARNRGDRLARRHRRLLQLLPEGAEALHGAVSGDRSTRPRRARGRVPQPRCAQGQETPAAPRGASGRSRGPARELRRARALPVRRRVACVRSAHWHLSLFRALAAAMADKGDSSRTAALLDDFVTSLRRRCVRAAGVRSPHRRCACAELAPRCTRKPGRKSAHLQGLHTVACLAHVLRRSACPRTAPQESGGLAGHSKEDGAADAPRHRRRAHAQPRGPAGRRARSGRAPGGGVPHGCDLGAGRSSLRAAPHAGTRLRTRMRPRRCVCAGWRLLRWSSAGSGTRLRFWQAASAALGLRFLRFWR